MEEANLMFGNKTKEMGGRLERREELLRLALPTCLVLFSAALMNSAGARQPGVPEAAWHQVKGEPPCQRPGHSKVPPTAYPTIDHGPEGRAAEDRARESF